MNTNLQIIISAVNNAAEALASVQGSLSELSTGASDAAASMTSSLSAAEQTIAEQAQAAADAWGTAVDSIPKNFEEIVPTTDELIQALVETNQQAAAVVANAWRASGQAMEADLAAAMTEVDTTMVADAAATGAKAGTAAGQGFEGYFKAMIVGLAVGQIGSVLSGGIDAAIAAVASSGNKISTLTAQIDQQKADIQVNEAALQKWMGTTLQVNAAHQKAAANIEAEKIKIIELTQQLAPLTTAQEGIPGQIQNIEKGILGWIGAHKQLDTSLQAFMTTLGPILNWIAPALIGFTLLKVALSVLDGPLLILIGIGVAIALLTSVWAAFHTQITNLLSDHNEKTGIIDLFKQSWQSISENFTTNLLPALQRLWTALQPLKPYFEAFAVVVGATLLGAIILLTDALTIAVNIFTDILTIGTKVATFFSTVLVGALNVVKDAIQAIITLVGKVGSAGGAIGGAISGALSAVHLASGGIVNSPTFALIGEAGPEAVIPLSAFAGGSSLGGGFGGGAGSGAINVYIQGGNYLDSGGATMIADALARRIGMQTKLKNFF